jgi:hypothetical protein
MVEGPGAVNNGCSVMEVTSDRSIRVTGFRNQKAYALPRA